MMSMLKVSLCLWNKWPVFLASQSRPSLGFFKKISPAQGLSDSPLEITK
jgi:hypothetical protein